MRRGIRAVLCMLFLSPAFALTGGCAYMRDRGNDALDIFDIGFTVSDKGCEPDFAVYVGILGNIPIGFACVDAKLLGIGNQQIGYMHYENESWGALAWGSAWMGCGKFNSKDTYQAREDQRDLKERPRFNTGPARMIMEDNTSPVLTFFECDKGVHLGWFGVLLNCRPVELIDFVVGWTTLDIVCDDLSHGAEARPADVFVWDVSETPAETGAATSKTGETPAE